MSDVTRILSQIESGDRSAAEELLPLVYDELRKLAARRLAHEASHTLQATALVHEAYLRLVGIEQGQRWDSRGHFFSAAAEAMRRILVESARRRQRLKRGGDLARQEFVEDAIASPVPAEEILAVHESLDRLEALHADAARLVKLRYFAGFTIPEAAENMGVSARKADQLWAYARAWLLTDLGERVSG